MRDPRTNRYVAEGTFETQKQAQAHQLKLAAQQQAGAWVNPHDGALIFSEYQEHWLQQRGDLRPRTKELYAGLLKNHLVPAFGAKKLNRITTADVRQWHASLISSGKPGATTTAKAYRLLHGIFNTAVEEERINKNPCRIKNAGVERAQERSVLTIEQALQFSEHVREDYKALVLVATFCALRLGELRALRRKHISPMHGTIQVVESLQEVGKTVEREGDRWVTGAPKTEAGIRRVTVPNAIMPALLDHLERFTETSPDAYVFSTRSGPLSKTSLYKDWRRVRASLGHPDLRIHDLRHTGNTLAASTGASLRDLMSRMGHSSTRAAMIYQHATSEQDQNIASALSDAITERGLSLRTEVSS